MVFDSSLTDAKPERDDFVALSGSHHSKNLLLPNREFADWRFYRLPHLVRHDGLLHCQRIFFIDWVWNRPVGMAPGSQCAGTDP